MSKLPARLPMPSILFALLSLGTMPGPALRTARIRIGEPARRTPRSRRMAYQKLD